MQKLERIEDYPVSIYEEQPCYQYGDYRFVRYLHTYTKYRYRIIDANEKEIGVSKTLKGAVETIERLKGWVQVLGGVFMRQHRCINCARYDSEEDKKEEPWCSILPQLDNCDEMEDPKTSWCGEWVALKHRLKMCVGGALQTLEYLRDLNSSVLVSDWSKVKIRDVIDLLERGLKK